MKFSAQEEYGLRCLLQIARDDSGSLTIPELAVREGLTEANVAKLMRVLRQAGLVKSSRGQKGGYQLSQPPERLRVNSILSALGGRLYSSDFCGSHSGREDTCVHNIDCSIRSLWITLDSAIEQTLSRMTLEDLLCTEHEMTGRGASNAGVGTLIAIPLGRTSEGVGMGH